VTRYFLRALAAHLRRGRSLFLLTLFGVALGVAAVLSIQIINANALAAFSGTMQAVSGEADCSVLGRTPSFDERLLTKVLGCRGVAAAWPLYRTQVALGGSGGGRPGSPGGEEEESFLEVLGIDLFAPVRLPVSAPLGEAVSALSRRGWVAVSPQLARSMHWAAGDSLRVSSGSRTAVLTIGALIDFQKMSPLAGNRLAVMDIAQVQSLLGRPGEIHQIDVRVDKGADLGAVMAELQRALGPSLMVLRPEQRRQQAAGLLSAFRLNLTALSLISLFVGIFLVYTSTQASLVRRREEFGLLRSLGATRQQVLALILGEVLLLAFFGTVAGLLLGYWAAEANLRGVNSTLSNLYLLEQIERLHLPPWLYLMAAVIGAAGALGGAIWPALDMSRRDTRSLLTAFTLHERVGSLARPLALTGTSILLAALLWFRWWGNNWKPGGFVLGLAVLVGLPLLTPLLVQAICGRIRIRGFGVRYSLKGLAVRLHTSSFAVAALGVAVSMLIGITLLVGSFRRTVETWVSSSVRADIYVTTVSWSRAGSEAALDPVVIEQLASVPGVRAIDRLRQFYAWSGGRRISLGGVDLGLAAGSARFPLVRGDPAEAIRRVREEGAVLIGEPLARKAHLGPGDMLRLTAPGGENALPIAGVYYDYTTEAGSAAVDLRTMERIYGPGPITNVALYLEPGLDSDRFSDLLKRKFAGIPLEIRSNRALRERILRIFDQTFAVTRILQLMSLLIAVSGITLTLLILARERVAELALYRALGAQRRQIFAIFLGEGIGIGVLGLLLGFLGGICLAVILVRAINPAYFGWTIRFHWPAGAIVEQAITILAAAALAGIYPAARASRVPAAELSREDV
jgi:putative ABC transport system permease protein